MATVAGNVNQVRTGAGKIWAAPFGTALPSSISATLDVAFVEVGFTTKGSSLKYSQSTDGVEVAERLRAIKQVVTEVEMSYEFVFAQLSPRNLALACATTVANSVITTATETTFVWPKAGGTSRVSLVWQSEDDLERMILARCYSTGDIEIPRAKGNDMASVSVEFTVEENSTVSTTIGTGANATAFRDAYHMFDTSLVS